MFQLYSIGEIRKQEDQTVILIKPSYRKALKYVELFSHIHVFSVDKGEEKQLGVQIAQVLLVDHKQGYILVKGLCEELIEGEVMDLKPYFPCEDTVRYLEESGDKKKLVISKEATARKINIEQEENAEYYNMKPIGSIRNTNGKIYLQLDSCKNLTSNYVKVIWWFHRFDDVKYRKVTQCDPPYENAPRTGIFASRSPVRPNPIAMTVTKVTRVDTENKRIYLENMECFDKTPCMGILEYGQEDRVLNAEVPEWLAHWPKFLEEKEPTRKVQDMQWKRSPLEDILEKESSNEERHSVISEKMERKEKSALFVKGAYENNLKGIQTTIPYGKITAVVGVSGSGKSSLVKDTIYAECKRRMEFLNQDGVLIPKPKMEGMTGCLPVVFLSQDAIHANAQSTIGTYTNAFEHLRKIYATIGVRHCPNCGEAILPLSADKIIQIVKQEELQVLDLQKRQVQGVDIEQRVEYALKEGKGALYGRTNDGIEILLQTRQKCYHCDTLLFSLTPATFSYVDAESRCPICNGTGEVMDVKEESIVEHPHKSLLEGASSFWGNLRTFIKNPNANWMKGQVVALARKREVALDTPWKDLPEDFRREILYGCDEEVTFQYKNDKNGRSGEITRKVEGAIEIIKRFYEENPSTRSLRQYLSFVPCHACHGERIGQEGRLVTIKGKRYPEVAHMTWLELRHWLVTLSEQLSQRELDATKEARNTLYEMTLSAENLGIEELEFDRCTKDISGGEGQRLKLMAALQNQMSGILYIFDEPSKGLHPKDYRKVAHLLRELKDEGNTILMVEHNEEMIKIADHVIELGPKAGKEGGYLMGEGSLQGMLSHAGTQLHQYMGNTNYSTKSCEEDSMQQTRLQLDWEKGNLTNAVEADTFLSCNHLKRHNLKDISVRFPKQGITCVCGVSGSGKTSLVKGEIYEQMKKSRTFHKIVLVDQQPIGKTSRSVIATYIGIMEGIRKHMAMTELAKERGFDEAMFSFNNEAGQCSTCKGEGRYKVAYAGDTWLPCPDCQGKRYKHSVLEITNRGKNVAELLEQSVGEALDFWKEDNEICRKLQMLVEVGLDYLKIGQSTMTLSGGEAARIKLATELMEGQKNNTLYLLDEPTTGLHFSDIERLLTLLKRLVKEGNTVITIEHNKQMVANCDWLIELGPGAGKKGGQLLQEGFMNRERLSQLWGSTSNLS
ncbi:TrmO family methyltransferase domain-containing protein [Anaerosporobacter faecicola]|uniref:TrmO family methyltransferase domain-containing protein n=1 Tax=Anaerosporobacter faecicola TaxID=2718714 RepID=UPI001438EDE4|nr:TrmO family methyltransferase [Anaerosporobacter faecicola]